MLNALFDSSTLPLLEQVVTFTEARHGVLAGNIANLDTPGYRCVDLSTSEFRERLKQAVEARRRTPAASPGELLEPEWARDEASPFAASAGDPLPATTTGLVKGMFRHDDNNASLEEQVSEISKNQSQHNMALSLMRAQFGLLRAAITERA